MLSGPWGWILATCFGLSVGSFANVVIYRAPREGLSSLRPARSFCPLCGARLAWIDNVPLLSWMLLGGRCRACRASISLRYPLVELLVGALFVLAWWWFAPTDGEGLLRVLVAWYLVATCVIVSAIDIEHFIIPDSITYPGMALGLAASFAFPWLHEGHPGFDPASPRGSAVVAALLGVLAGAGSLYLVGRLGNLLFARKVAEAGVADSMGLGDVKWMALAGTFLGATEVLSAILLACFLGALHGLALRLVALARGRPGAPGLPFGPYLALGMLVEYAVAGRPWALDQLQRVVEQIVAPA